MINSTGFIPAPPQLQRRADDVGPKGDWMPFRSVNGLRYYIFDILKGAPIFHGVFTRKGGISPAPWARLNLGGTVGDSAEHVSENRKRIFQCAGRPLESLFDVWQVHSADVVCTREPRPSHTPHQKADVILTDSPQVTLLMRFADCVPVLLYDPEQQVVGLAHAGWQGTVKKTVAAAVETMQARYHSKPGNILAGIGPSIGPHHYPVGAEVVDQVIKTFGNDSQSLLQKQDGAVKFDLWEANRMILNQAGVNQVEISGLCTACHLEDWFSHRGEHGKTGRFGVLIGLR